MLLDEIKTCLLVVKCLQKEIKKTLKRETGGGEWERKSRRRWTMGVKGERAKKSKKEREIVKITSLFTNLLILAVVV